MVAGMLLAACGSGDSGSSSGGKEPQTITFSYGPANANDNAYEVLAKDYEAAHPGVTIKVNKISAETYGQTLQTQMAAGNGPDVMQVNSGGGQPGTVGTLAKPGLLLKLTDSSFTSNIPEAERVGYDYKGELYGVPSATAIMSVIYNEDLAKQNNVNITPTTTLDDVVKQCGTVPARQLDLRPRRGRPREHRHHDGRARVLHRLRPGSRLGQEADRRTRRRSPRPRAGTRRCRRWST